MVGAQDVAGFLVENEHRLGLVGLRGVEHGPAVLDDRPPHRRFLGVEGVAWTDYRDLIQAAHTQLDGPIILVWDNLNTHLTAGMRDAARARLRLVSHTNNVRGPRNNRRYGNTNL